MLGGQPLDRPGQARRGPQRAGVDAVGRLGDGHVLAEVGRQLHQRGAHPLGPRRQPAGGGRGERALHGDEGVTQLGPAAADALQVLERLRTGRTPCFLHAARCPPSWPCAQGHVHRRREPDPARAGRPPASVGTMAGSGEGRGPTRYAACARSCCGACRRCGRSVSHGEPTWFAGGGQGVRDVGRPPPRRPRRGSGRRRPTGVQGRLVADDPDRYFVPPYVGGRGWVGVRLDVPDVDWDRVEQVVQDAYRTVASKALLARLGLP